MKYFIGMCIGGALVLAIKPVCIAIYNATK